MKEVLIEYDRILKRELDDYEPLMEKFEEKKN